MRAFAESPIPALVCGIALIGFVLALWVGIAGVDLIGLVSFLLRYTHVLAAIAWVGFIFFVNFIQINALKHADDGARAAFRQAVALPVAVGFRHASHLTLLSGALLLITTGYLLDRWIFSSPVYIPPLRNLLLWGGTLGGLLMWAFVNFAILPNLKIALGSLPGDAEAKAAARHKVHLFARLNLMLALPVTFVMVAAAHLY